MASDKAHRIAFTTEIVGGLAVLVTLIILVIEVRENTETNRRANLIQLTTAPLSAYLDNPEIQAISAKISESQPAESNFQKILLDEFGLSREEAQLYGRYLGYNWRIRESEYLYGNSDPVVFEQNMRFNLRDRPAQLYWEHGTAPYHPEFRAYIESLLKE